MKPLEPISLDCTPIPTAPILVVDDDENMLTMLEATLDQQHYRIVATANPATAIEELKKQDFSVILSDQRMPGISGLELLSQARQLRPNSTRILITGVLELETVVEAINKGEIFRFIVKPWLREEFLATMNNGVQRYELICQNARLQAGTQAMNEQLVEMNRSLEQQIKLVARQNQQLAEMNEALNGNFFRSLELCVHAMQTFYPRLGNEARRVTCLCKSIASVLHLPPDEQRVIESCARLYDIGLVGVPRHIIRRWQDDPERLDPAEKALIQQHPILGQELAAFGSGLDNVGEIIRAHHEQFDGAGYPDGLRGENIPWLARLLAVTVAYASSRLPASDALDDIKSKSGSEFDPDAVRVVMRALPLAPLPRKEKELPLGDLRSGMVLARGIYTCNGLLLLPEGQHLNGTCIEKLLNHNRIQPINQSLVVYG
jgi:response regulator RpfG family c-di-GMP phosphodiesterase